MIPKFRAYIKKSKKIYPVNDLTLNGIDDEPVGINGCGDSTCTTCLDWYRFEDIELMQSTGLKDKNGVEIFEGDIVNYDDGEFSYIGSVKKDCYQFYINGIEPVDSYDFIDVSNTFDGTTSLTIIGNIYENPELLEDKYEK